MQNGRNDFIEQKSMLIEVITPICMGNNNALSYLDYLYDRDRKKVYMLNQHEWFNYLSRHSVLPRYITNLEKNSPKAPYQWLTTKSGLGANAITLEKLGKALKTEIEVFKNLQLDNSGAKIQPTVRLVAGNIYIPGSAIKGMLRTAILFHLIRQKNNEKLRKEYWNKVVKEIHSIENKKIDEIKAKLEELDNELENYLLKIKTEKDFTDDTCSNDCLRGVRCGDAMLVDGMPNGKRRNVPTAIVKKIDIKDKPYKPNEINVYFETIRPGTKFQFTLTLEKPLLANIGISSVDDLMKILEEYYQSLNKVLMEGFPNRHDLFTKMRKGNAYLGRNTGFLHKSLLWALADTPKDAVPVIRTILHNEFEDHKHNMDKQISPHMLKCVKFGKELQLMGGVRIYRV